MGIRFAGRDVQNSGPLPGQRSMRVGLVLLWIIPLLFMLIFFLYPLGSILRLAVQATFQQGLQLDEINQIWGPLSFTIYQAILSTLLTLVVGLPAAYIFGRFQFPGKGLLRILTTLPFILPTVVVAASFNALLGPGGWVNLLLMRLLALSTPPIQILNTLSAILLGHVFYNTTIVIRVVGGAWEQLDPRLEQAARVLGASTWRTFWEVTLPLLRPALYAALLLVFMFDFTSFGVILLLGGPYYATIEVDIYVQALQMLNLPLAGLLSAVQLLFTLILTGGYSFLSWRRIVPLAPRLYGEGLRRAVNWRERLAIGGIVAVLVVLLIIPLGALAVRSVTQLTPNPENHSVISPALTLDYYAELFINRRETLFYVPPIDAVRNSLIFASATVIISLSLGLIIATLLSRSFSLNRLLDPLIMLPLGTSAVTLGLGFIVAFNRPPLNLLSYPWLIPVAHSLVALPLVVRTLQPALLSIPPTLRQAAAVLGASPWQVWREVDLPIVARAAVVSAIFAFTISLGEFGATSFLARPQYPTMPIAIFGFLSLPGALNYGQSLAMATLLMLVCAISILVLERFRLPGASDF